MVGQSWPAAYLHPRQGPHPATHHVSRIGEECQGAEGAVAWAASAGIPVTPKSARIEELLCSHETFAEDLFSTLLDQPGFPACDAGARHA